MSTIAVRRTAAVLLATLLAAVAYHSASTHRAEAVVRPARSESAAPAADEGKPRRPVIGSGVKFVRSADGSVTRTR